VGGELRSLSVVFGPDGPRLQARYVSGSAPNPGTKARMREVEELIRAGLYDALRALDEGGVALTQEAVLDTLIDRLRLWARSEPEGDDRHELKV
jgi:hypothetical protein